MAPSTDSSPPRTADVRPSGRWPRLLLIGSVVALLVGYSLYFQIPQGSAGVVVRFGRPMREVTAAGPGAKFPWPIEEVRLIDTRSRLFQTPLTATLTRDRKNVILLTYFVWRVEQPLLFLQSLGTPEAGDRKLDGMVTASKNFHLGDYELTSLLSTDPTQIRTSEIEQKILADVAAPAKEKFGVLVEQVGIQRIAYPEENIRAVLAQMRAERKTEADRLRAEGEKEARRIRDESLVQGEELLREGREEAGRIRGAAEKEAASIYAQVHQTDPEFYRFWRSLQAMRNTLGPKATLILRSDQAFFDILSQPTGENSSKPSRPHATGEPVAAPRN